MSFDEEHRGEHDECAAEIRKLQDEIAALRQCHHCGHLEHFVCGECNGVQQYNATLPADVEPSAVDGPAIERVERS